MGILPPYHAARNLAKLLSNNNSTSKNLNTAMGQLHVSVWTYAPMRKEVREKFIPLLKQAAKKVSGETLRTMEYRIKNLQRYCERLHPIRYRPQS